jgi:predicted enzyme involved in methoxymalonyl-ACP biosynthesis
MDRESVRAVLSRDEFLTSLECAIELEVISDTKHGDFPRALELLNKTNQFNTTGKRWALNEIAKLFGDFGYLLVFRASDRLRTTA